MSRSTRLARSAALLLAPDLRRIADLVDQAIAAVDAGDELGALERLHSARAMLRG